jgi:hypothetical protein
MVGAGVVGLAVGGAVGYVAAEGLPNTGATFDSMGNAVYNGAGQAGGAVIGGVENFGNYAGDAAGDIPGYMNTAGDYLGNGMNDVGGYVNDAGGFIGDNVGDIGNALESFAGDFF